MVHKHVAGYFVCTLSPLHLGCYSDDDVKVGKCLTGEEIIEVSTAINVVRKACANLAKEKEKTELCCGRQQQMNWNVVTSDAVMPSIKIRVEEHAMPTNQKVSGNMTAN